MIEYSLLYELEWLLYSKQISDEQYNRYRETLLWWYVKHEVEQGMKRYWDKVWAKYFLGL
jgi:hypothetical protein